MLLYLWALENTARIPKCHGKNHTVRSCVEEKCESSFFCGDLSKHPDEKLAFQEKKRIIATLEKSVKKVSQELTARQAGFPRVTNSINKNIAMDCSCHDHARKPQPGTASLP